MPRTFEHARVRSDRQRGAFVAALAAVRVVIFPAPAVKEEGVAEPADRPDHHKPVALGQCIQRRPGHRRWVDPHRPRPQPGLLITITGAVAGRLRNGREKAAGAGDAAGAWSVRVGGAVQCGRLFAMCCCCTSSSSSPWPRRCMCLLGSGHSSCVGLPRFPSKPAACPSPGPRRQRPLARRVPFPHARGANRLRCADERWPAARPQVRPASSRACSTRSTENSQFGSSTTHEGETRPPMDLAAFAGRWRVSRRCQMVSPTMMAALSGVYFSFSDQAASY